MKTNYILGSYFCLLFIMACGDSKPTTPEEVFKQYQYYIDYNEFDKARELASPATLEYINFLESISSNISPRDLPENLQVESKIEKIDCKITEDKANCSYCCNAEKEAGEITLIKVNGNWLVDEKFDNTEDVDNDIEKIINDIENKLDNQLKEVDI